MRAIIIFLFLASYAGVANAQAQEAIITRTILIGDAGQLDSGQQQVIRSAAKQILKGKTTVLFLGDDVYPRGMALQGTADQEHTRDILKSQFEPMRAGGGKVYFLPGNHDWDRSGPQGLRKVQAAWKFISD